MSDPEFPIEVKAALEIAEKMKSECKVEGFNGESWYYLTGGSYEYCKGYIAGGAERWDETRIVCDVYILPKE